MTAATIYAQSIRLMLLINNHFTMFINVNMFWLLVAHCRWCCCWWRCCWRCWWCCSCWEELRKLDRSGELYVIGLILENPFIYLHEVCQELKECFDFTISPSTFVHF